MWLGELGRGVGASWHSEVTAWDARAEGGGFHRTPAYFCVWTWPSGWGITGCWQGELTCPVGMVQHGTHGTLHGVLSYIIVLCCSVKGFVQWHPLPTPALLSWERCSYRLLQCLALVEEYSRYFESPEPTGLENTVC